MSSPSNTMRPENAGRIPEIERSVVLLPAPFAPISATSCPCLIDSEMPLMASTLP